jgi:serralysin
MATFSFTADASTNTASTPVQVLAVNDVVFVGREATLTALGATSEVFSGVSDHQMTINGELFAADDDAVFTTGGGNTVMVGGDAFISAEGQAFDFGAGSNKITNAGAIQTEGLAIDIGGTGSNQIFNTGLISTLSTFGLRVDGTFNEIVNTGAIVGSGILCTGGFNNIRNSGIVASDDGTWISVGGLAGESNFVVNAGTVQGTFNGFDANDTLINKGQLFGAVSLGSGDDLFDGREGVASGGIIFGQGGDDTLWGGNGDETFNGGSGADFISGGVGFDFVSFTSAVRASLSDPSQNTREALGDEYEGVEGLLGSGDNDLLTGNAAANTLDGGGGNDILAGLAGNDRYNVDVATDRVIEAASGGGIDTVFAISSFALNTNGANVESLRLQGSGNTFAKGTSLNNNLYGNSGDNLLDGLAGNDALVGRDGNDTFRFSTTLNATTNVDRILDFTVADDTIAVDNAKFTGLASGNLLAGHFFIGAAAHDGNDRIIYNAANGALMFDRDGTGAIAAVRFATLDAGLALTAADFVVV